MARSIDMSHDKPRPDSPASQLRPKSGDYPEPAKAAPPSRKLAKTPADQRFDMWLEKQLHAMYEVESEPGST